ncbi:HAP CCAAT-binding (Hap2/3/4/5) transcriptional modulator complex subunit, putative [Candida dubliniensis CD36]|uniref:Transcriptional activator, putative n=1 Tax=Candida dubliniensis (strain CD36 / ATCC MYA-646 / CBS 7987 / NCPF 3949 / NRRL Y-17841) TaxID=573826 RepID=B9WH75_CANDC|nr:HAP CCAAT-binding (Hap2/3/4/5) transcriptional modulator complex subunit, putative [Candida dubliniensis CD36]CAX41516.1 HAP CCAAT-binding (Hap2/3/4/5) transcriptional modulator complex subunit, putative [Candida dubliniensis CD36]
MNEDPQSEIMERYNESAYLREDQLSQFDQNNIVVKEEQTHIQDHHPSESGSHPDELQDQGIHTVIDEHEDQVSTQNIVDEEELLAAQAAAEAAAAAQQQQPGDVFNNVAQGLSGKHRDMMMQYWQETINSIEHDEHDFKNHQLPLARIKKVMKTDEDVRMISAEAPILFAKGCDVFITELTMRAWIHAEENKRRTLQKSDIAAALTKSDMFDFLIDVVPREEEKPKKSNNSSSRSDTYVNTQQSPQIPEVEEEVPNMLTQDVKNSHSDALQQQILQDQLLQQQLQQEVQQQLQQEVQRQLQEDVSPSGPQQGSQQEEDITNGVDNSNGHNDETTTYQNFNGYQNNY